MPTASDEVRAPWHNEDAGYDGGAADFLEACGWTEKEFCLMRPLHPHVISPREYSAVDYLCDEWDWDVSLYPEERSHEVLD